MINERVRKTLFATLFVLCTAHAVSQVAWFVPDNPSVDDTVILHYNTNSGNMGLAGTTDDVFFHTGAITDRSIDGGDWKHIVGNWGERDEHTLMTMNGDGIYTYSMVIRDFYNIGHNEKVNQLAFVFRNENGSLVGKTSKSEDVFLSVDGYIPPKKGPTVYSFDSRKYISHFDHDSIIDVLTDHGITQIIPYTKNIIEVRHFPHSIAHDDTSEAVILVPQFPLHTVLENNNWIKIRTDSLSLIIHKDPFYLAFVYDGDTILSEEKGYYRRSDNNGLRFKIDDDEKIYGLGERANGINLVGSRYNLYNRPKYGYEYGALNLNYSVPLVVSSKKFLMLFDNPQKGYADVGEKEEGILEWGAIGGDMRYFIVAGSNFKTIASQYSHLTGFQPLPPLWALGNLQSRMGYRSQYELDSITNLTIDEDFPLDAMIIDLYWFGDSLQGTMGRLKWYEPNWPEPANMISTLKQKGVKTILITEPYILDSLTNFHIADSLNILALDTNGDTYVNREFYFGHGALLDIFKPEAGNWFWTKYKEQMDIGVEGWWGDLGEPENHPADQVHIVGMADEVHNIYGHFWHKAIFENFRKDYPQRRLFNLNRAGYAGSQRYSIFPWTGDVSRSWGGLKAQIPLMLHMGLSGLPAIHSDAGGFAQGAMDNELYTRWLQMSCFSPILRPHGSGIPSEPVYFNDTTKMIVRNFMKLRYQLMPYIYSLYAEASIHGYPIVRPLFFEFPDDPATYTIEFEYMFGDDILIVPIVEKGQETAEVYLPQGKKWYNFHNDFIYDGGKKYTEKLNLETIPIFIKSGSYIPYVPYFNTTDKYNTENYTFTYYFDHSQNTNTYTMFEDDGHTFGTIASGDYRLITLTRSYLADGQYEYGFTMEGNGYTDEPSERQIVLEIVGLNRSDIKGMKINGNEMKLSLKDTINPGEYFYNPDSGRWYVSFIWGSEPVRITQTGMIK